MPDAHQGGQSSQERRTPSIHADFRHHAARPGCARGSGHANGTRQAAGEVARPTGTGPTFGGCATATQELNGLWTVAITEIRRVASISTDYSFRKVQGSAYPAGLGSLCLGRLLDRQLMSMGPRRSTDARAASRCLSSKRRLSPTTAGLTHAPRSPDPRALRFSPSRNLRSRVPPLGGPSANPSRRRRCGAAQFGRHLYLSLRLLTSPSDGQVLMFPRCSRPGSGLPFPHSLAHPMLSLPLRRRRRRPFPAARGAGSYGQRAGRGKCGAPYGSAA
jgi:hypothetical protein